jgi:hypothetical protein
LRRLHSWTISDCYDAAVEHSGPLVQLKTINFDKYARNAQHLAGCESIWQSNECVPSAHPRHPIRPASLPCFGPYPGTYSAQTSSRHAVNLSARGATSDFELLVADDFVYNPLYCDNSLDLGCLTLYSDVSVLWHVQTAWVG